MLNVALPITFVTQVGVILGFLSKKEVPLWGRVGPDYNRPKLLDRVHFACRRRHLSPRTESADIHWIKRYIFFHNKQHPKDLDARHIEAFLNHLTVQRRVSASTQSIDLNALAFLYKQVLQVELPELDTLVRAKKPKRLPVVLSRGNSGDSIPISLSELG